MGPLAQEKKNNVNKAPSFDQVVEELRLDELEHCKPRLPSPMMWRFFPVAGKPAFLPVMTWFPTGYKPAAPARLAASEGVFKYLHGKLGFEKSLTGRDLGA